LNFPAQIFDKKEVAAEARFFFPPFLLPFPFFFCAAILEPELRSS
jgi:hypothetical protein